MTYLPYFVKLGRTKIEKTARKVMLKKQNSHRCHGNRSDCHFCVKVESIVRVHLPT